MIIGIDGFAGSGKDTVADILVKEGFTKISFADSLRESAVHSTGLPMNLFLDRDLKDKPFDNPYILDSTAITLLCNYVGYPDKVQAIINKYTGKDLESPRQILQFIGTEIGREMIAESLWVDKWCQKAQWQGRVVSPDARMSNEREKIKELGGLNFYIEREGYGPSENHKSGQDKWSKDMYDVVINNTDKLSLMQEIGLWWSLKGSRLR